jgi:hypothetical protein
LRQYAALHHNVPIWLFISQDIGTNSGPDCTACGPTAITLWQNGTSGCGYAFGRVEQPHRAHHGYVFPDFAEVSPVDLVGTSSAPLPAPLNYDWTPLQQAIIVVDTEAEPCDPTAPGGPEGEDAGAAPGMGGAGAGAAPAFLSAGSGDPMYCTKCVDNAQIQWCIENVAQPECNSIRLGIDRDRDAMLAYVNNVIEPMLLAQCNYWSCAALRWACRNGAYATTGLMRKAIEATWLAAVEELNWLVCPRLEADCVDAWSCLVQDGEQCPAVFPTTGDSGIPCYSEDLASLGCQ